MNQRQAKKLGQERDARILAWDKLRDRKRLGSA